MLRDESHTWLTGCETCQERWSFNGSGSRCVTCDPAALFPCPFRYSRMSSINCTQLKPFSGQVQWWHVAHQQKLKYHWVTWNVLMAQSHQAHQAPCSIQSLCDSQDSAPSSVIITMALKIWIPYWVLTHVNLLLSNIKKFHFYYKVNLSRIVGNKVPLWVNILYFVPGNGKVQFQFMFLCRYEI